MGAKIVSSLLIVSEWFGIYYHANSTEMFYSIDICYVDVSLCTSTHCTQVPFPVSCSQFCRHSLAKLYRNRGNLVVTQSQSKLSNLYIYIYVYI
jgi:hypothetical protein